MKQAWIDLNDPDNLERVTDGGVVATSNLYSGDPGSNLDTFYNIRQPTQ